MKKILAMAIGMAALASIASAQTATYSQNAVGFINIEAKANDLYALAIPFDNMEDIAAGGLGEWSFVDTQLAKDAPKSSWVYFWDDEGQKWEPVMKRNNFSTTRKLKAGEFFFFKPSADMTITIAGQVPDDDEIPVSVVGSSNISALGNPYPVELDFDSSAIATNAAKSSWVYFWDEEGQKWDPVMKRSSFSTKKTVLPGRGFFFKSAGDAMSWDSAKPYEYP